MFNWTTLSFAQNSIFSDVGKDNKYYFAINFLKEKNIIKGYDDGTFRPDQTINRAEALKIIFLSRDLLGLPGGNETKISFPDVKNNDWFAGFVKKAVDLKIVEGYQDGTFKPANQITAGESLKIMMTGLIKNYQLSDVKENPFTDVIVDQWYTPYLADAKNLQFIEANEDGSYSPNRSMSRGDFAEAIYRILYTQLNNLDNFPLNLNWPYCNNYELGYKVKTPLNWDVLAVDNQLIIWRKDNNNGQVSFARVYPNSAVAIIAVDMNRSKLSLNQFMKKIEYGDKSNTEVITLNGLPYASVYIEESGLQDSYFQMPDGKIVIIYSQIGDGNMKEQLKNELKYILGSIRSSNKSEDGEKNCLSIQMSNEEENNVNNLDQLTNDILKQVLAEGKAEIVLNKVNDKIIIETDSIGIGTGPIDYYFSESLNFTIKVDRNAKTILATKTGKTTAF